MCLSPHEMDNERLQYEIDRLREYADSPDTGEYYKNYYEGRIERLTEILKERAEQGKMIAVDGS